LTELTRRVLAEAVPTSGKPAPNAYKQKTFIDAPHKNALLALPLQCSRINSFLARTVALQTVQNIEKQKHKD
jgi:hypothetical protein